MINRFSSHCVVQIYTLDHLCYEKQNMIKRNKPYKYQKTEDDKSPKKGENVPDKSHHAIQYDTNTQKLDMALFDCEVYSTIKNCIISALLHEKRFKDLQNMINNGARASDKEEPINDSFLTELYKKTNTNNFSQIEVVLSMINSFGQLQVEEDDSDRRYSANEGKLINETILKRKELLEENKLLESSNLIDIFKSINNYKSLNLEHFLYTDLNKIEEMWTGLITNDKESTDDNNFLKRRLNNISQIKDSMIKGLNTVEKNKLNFDPRDTFEEYIDSVMKSKNGNSRIRPLLDSVENKNLPLISRDLGLRPFEELNDNQRQDILQLAWLIWYSLTPIPKKQMVWQASIIDNHEKKMEDWDNGNIYINGELFDYSIDDEINKNKGNQFRNSKESSKEALKSIRLIHTFINK